MAEPIAAADPADGLRLPVLLRRSDILPPAPTKSPTGSTIDWIPDFAGYAWVAYGASSLLVIAHLPKPSPLSRDEAAVGSVLRQVFELPHHVSAVSWSSNGEVAAASGDCVFLFAPDTSRSLGSFCWSQNAVLRQLTKVEVVKWTESGDGIVAGGIEVVLWKTKSTSWEIAWKSKVHVPQTLASTTWSIEGPSATANYPDEQFREESRCVFVLQNDVRHGYLKTELWHPQPVVMIQWRPSTGRRLKNSLRTMHLLLTSCLDGALRLWAEIDHGRHRRAKDLKDSKVLQCSFHVVALIETSNGLNHSLDAPHMCVMWAIEIRGFFNLGEEASHLTPIHDDHELGGQCEWLIGFGPGMKMTFWAVHCIDEFSPLRYPRVTLWKTKDLHDLKLEHSQSAHSIADGGPLVKQIVISRSSSRGPPILCSLLRFTSSSSLSLSFFSNEREHHLSGAPGTSDSEKFLSCVSSGVLSTDGHSGKILQVAMHPNKCGLAVSLDYYGVLRFWLLSTISGLSYSVPNPIPIFRVVEKVKLNTNGTQYTSIRWAPSVLSDDRILFLGHVDGIDCLVVRMSKEEEPRVECYELCTIPYIGIVPVENSPAEIYSISLPSSCMKTFKPNKFTLWAVWKEFHVLAWEVTIHSYDLAQSHDMCNCIINKSDTSKNQNFEGVFAERRYYLSVSLCSAEFPHPHHDLVTSFSIICPDKFFPFVQQEEWTSNNDRCENYYPYVMGTGYADGTVKLWRTSLAERPPLKCELVGAFSTQKGSIKIISLADYGQKVACVCATIGSESSETLYIWDPVNIARTGCFVLEHTELLPACIVAMKWLSLGNGEHILGVCLHEKLLIYAQRRFNGQGSLSTSSSMMQIWSCIAEAHLSAHVVDFFWGPGATAVVVHCDYISLFTQWMLNRRQDETKRSLCNGGRTEKDSSYAIFADPCIPVETKCTYEANMVLERPEQSYSVGGAFGSQSLLDLVKELCGSIPVYHPAVMRFNIYSGNWRRAYIALRHLVEHLSNAPSKRYADLGNTIPQIVLSSYLEGTFQESSTNKGFQWDGSAVSINSLQFQVCSIKPDSEMWSYSSSNLLPPSSSSTYNFSGIAESLEKFSGTIGLSDKEMREILATKDLLIEVSNPQSSSVYESLDEPGKRFWVGVKYWQLQFIQEFGRVPSVEELVIDSETVCWAFHSDCQESLFCSFLPSESSWKELRAMGVGLWFNNVTQLRTRMEKLSRLQYLKKKDPKECALLYVALNRLQVLAGLFKISRDEKDKPLVAFLTRNFQEEKNKAAALKNAYVLLGRHQWELAIAFFLLGGDTSSAINICTKNLGDEQLALVLCRLVEGSGGPLERHLITKFMLPSAIEKDDYWRASILEWQLGNYSRSFFCMLGLQNYSRDESMVLSSHVGFSDPVVGLYCRLLTTKNCLRNTVGEYNATVFGRWATVAMATALRRRGLNVEALECLCSSNFVGGSNHGNSMDNGQFEVLPGILEPSPCNSTNWLSADVAPHLETYTRFDLAIRHFSRTIRLHPDWPYANMTTFGLNPYLNNRDTHDLKKFREHLLSNLLLDLDVSEQKFQLPAAALLGKILALPCSLGAPSIGYDLLQGYQCDKKSLPTIEALGSLNFYPLLSELCSTLVDEVSILFSRLTSVCGITCSQGASPLINICEQPRIGSGWLFHWGNHIRDLTLLLRNLRISLEIFTRSRDDNIFMVVSEVIDLLEVCACFASLWSQRNSKALILLLQPILVSLSDGHIPYEVKMADLKEGFSHESNQLVSAINVKVDVKDCSSSSTAGKNHDNGGSGGKLIPEDERWQILGVSVWKHLWKFTMHRLKMLQNKAAEDCNSSSSLGEPLSSPSSAVCSEDDRINIIEHVKLLCSRLCQMLITTLTHVSSYQVEQLVVLLHEKVDHGWPAMTLKWLESPNGFLKEHPLNEDITLSLSNINDELSFFHKLWDLWADPKIVSECLAEERIHFLEYIKRRPSRGWKEICQSLHDKIEGSHSNAGRSDCSSGSSEVSSPSRGSLPKGLAASKEITAFECPRDICKRNGELLEALCINSSDSQQIAVSSHRKGIIFMNWEELPSREETQSIWTEADWPSNGWAGSQLTPVPTFVSPGIGLGSQKGAHLGMVGSNFGTGSLSAPGRDFTGGGALRVRGYSGVGASGLGWEEFDELIEHPATVESVRTRAFSSHPSMPYFLVGSSNTHVYLWEFGKEKAVATYGVLPSAHVPPPYSLASVSAVQFGPCGHRFATAALDGTICTWQLEVGGRSNIHPTESSLCFNSHAMDVTYVTASGSIIVASGYSSNNVNVVIWDTLAPPSTSRASIVCHEGGARSVSVFDSDIGSSSVSPLILTGGKGGDVGLHDFRYIATGKSKRLRHPDHGDHSNSPLGTTKPTENGVKHGIENVEGMLWYLPKAHLGSVTKISKIPNTSLFLTASKDGDVKLWDVKNAKLVHHWPKLHEKHTFLQPSTRGFGGVVRAGVTDVKVVPHGFLSCGGDGTVKLVQLSDGMHGM